MKRRTRLRKLGLPADPPKPGRPVLPTWTAAQSLELVRELRGTRLPAAYATNFEVVQDCRRYGIRETVLSLSTLGVLPSAVLDAGRGRSVTL